MNLTTLVRKVQRLFGDTSNEIVIQQTDIFDWVDEAQLQIARKTHCLTKSVPGVVASTFPLALPADWIMSKRLVYGNTILKFVEIDDLDALSYDATIPVDSPSVYYIFNKQINLYPNKGATDTTQLRHDYVCAPTVIASIATPLDVPLSYHEDIVRYCVMRAHERNENYKTQQTSSDTFEAYSGERMQESTVQNEDNFVIRDDPGENDAYAAFVY
jgi:hypothetical protein